MKVFISWSRPRSREVATALKTLIEECLAPISVWTSDEDIEAGVKWYNEIERHLGQAGVGILCITAESLNSAWVLFEAGALMRAGKLIPYLIDKAPNELPGPLLQYQAKPNSLDGTLAVMKAINTEAENVIDEGILERRFDAFWPTVAPIITGIRTSRRIPLENWLGLEGAFQRRIEGFDAFIGYLRAEIEPTGPRERVWIIGSSMQGFDIGVGRTEYSIWDAIDRANSVGCLRVLLTAPEVSHYREGPEGRLLGQIKQEIGTTLLKLLDQWRVRNEFIKLYPGTPTVSGIATSTHVLLNPYPYGRTATFCFSLIARKTSDEGDIYNQYIDAHFERGWKFGRHLSEEDERWLDDLRQKAK